MDWSGTTQLPGTFTIIGCPQPIANFRIPIMVRLSFPTQVKQVEILVFWDFGDGSTSTI